MHLIYNEVQYIESDGVKFDNVARFLYYIVDTTLPENVDITSLRDLFPILTSLEFKFYSSRALIDGELGIFPNELRYVFDAIKKTSYLAWKEYYIKVKKMNVEKTMKIFGDELKRVQFNLKNENAYNNLNLNLDLDISLLK